MPATDDDTLAAEGRGPGDPLRARLCDAISQRHTQPEIPTLPSPKSN
ncbi:MAG TPA: hypothetical protein VL689_07375 [Paraburkholderia sp.]|nr:hypothetical protein [Paraburkholderia sp.]